MEGFEPACGVEGEGVAQEQEGGGAFEGTGEGFDLAGVDRAVERDGSQAGAGGHLDGPEGEGWSFLDFVFGGDD